jgi:uncharacterized GH25 family protein
MTRSILALALLVASPAAAHDFWIQPGQFRLDRPGSTTLTLQVGHGAEHQRSQIRAGRIMRLAVIAPDGGERDLRTALHIGDDSDAAFGLTGGGAHVLVLETDDHAQSRLPASRYNAYLAEEGLTPVALARTQAHRNGAEGSETYRRAAKAIIQVGQGGDQGQATRPFGLPLEIVPERSPYALPRAANLPLRVLLHGRPLPGALVKLTDLDHDASPVGTTRTDTEGRAVFPLPANGLWQLNVVWSEARPQGAETEYETTFSSLTFGFR